MKNEKYKNIIILKENNFYYPIFEIIKNKTSNKFNIYKTFDFSSNFVSVFRDFILKNCKNNLVTNNFYNARNIITFFENNNIKIKEQIIDNRNKCMFILTKKFPTFMSILSKRFITDNTNFFHINWLCSDNFE